MYTIKEFPTDFKVTEILTYKKDNEGKFALFLLEKESYNTIDAINKIASWLSISSSKIGFCGNKDRIAITKQYITIPKSATDKLKLFSMKDLSLTFVDFVSERLNLGDLEENAFEIIVKNTSKRTISSFDNKKVLNLFGAQRFSTHNANIGKAIVTKDFKQAIEILIEDDSYSELLRNHLEKHHNDYIGALKIVGTSLLKLFIHAYQSKLWNQCIELLVSKYPDIKQQEIPIIGFGSELKEPIARIYEEIMDEEEITFRDFIIKQFKELSAEGQTRNLFMKIENFKAIYQKKEKNWKLTFKLSKGSYATVLIDFLFESQ